MAGQVEATKWVGAIPVALFGGFLAVSFLYCAKRLPAKSPFQCWGLNETEQGMKEDWNDI